MRQKFQGSNAMTSNPDLVIRGGSVADELGGLGRG
jgi:hypothetical protein